MGHAIVPFVQHLFPVFMTSLKDEDDEVKSNAIYGLGLLAFYGGDVITPYPYMHWISIAVGYILIDSGSMYEVSCVLVTMVFSPLW